jgi:1-acyl-sn-glycerol-3-phosphate acyltransferase
MVLRLPVILLWTLLSMLIQSVMLILPGRGKECFARMYWQGMAAILGVRLTVIGRLAEHRPVLFIANHSSWLDIIALGSVLPGCFVAKGAIADWPLINWVARLGRTIFVSRNRSTVNREQHALSRRLAAGDNVILFPEGTTSDGNRILPFSSAFLALADVPAKPYVQPVTIVYDRLDGLPVRKYDRPGISWYGDMDLASHYKVVAQRRRTHATIILDAEIPPGSFPNRKALSAALEARLARNAAALRQGRVAQ